MRAYNHLIRFHLPHQPPSSSLLGVVVADGNLHFQHRTSIQQALQVLGSSPQRSDGVVKRSTATGVVPVECILILEHACQQALVMCVADASQYLAQERQICIAQADAEIVEWKHILVGLEYMLLNYDRHTSRQHRLRKPNAPPVPARARQQTRERVLRMSKHLARRVRCVATSATLKPHRPRASTYP